MPASIFRDMHHVMMDIFKDDSGENRWFPRGGDPNGYVVDVMFNAAYTEVDRSGIKTTEEEPVLWIKTSDVQRFMPSRWSSLVDLDIAVNNDDRFSIAGRIYRVVSCKFDGHGLLEVRLKKPINA